MNTSIGGRRLTRSLPTDYKLRDLGIHSKFYQTDDEIENMKINSYGSNFKKVVSLDTSVPNRNKIPSYTREVCHACMRGYLNQESHMEIGGCLYVPN